MGMTGVIVDRGRSAQMDLEDFTVLDLAGDGRRCVLVAADGNESSLRAAAYAAGLAQRQAVRLVVLYVHSLGLLASTPDSIHAMRAANFEAVRGLRAEMVRQAAALGVDITVVERAGSPFGETRRLAVQLRADAVVVAHGRTFGHYFVSLRLSRMAHHTQCPVTVIP